MKTFILARKGQLLLGSVIFGSVLFVGNVCAGMGAVFGWQAVMQEARALDGPQPCGGELLQLLIKIQTYGPPDLHEQLLNFQCVKARE